MAKKTVGKEVRFLNVLLSGKTVSRKQAHSNYRLGNPSATVLRIQDAGYNLNRIYTTKKVKANGKTHIIRTVKYNIS